MTSMAALNSFRIDPRRRPKQVRGEASQRLQGQIDQIEKEYPSDTIQRLRNSIKGLAIIDRLQRHVFGEIALTATQIRAAEILLNRILPTLASVQVSPAATDRPTVIFAPTPCETSAEWEALVAARRAVAEDEQKQVEEAA